MSLRESLEISGMETSYPEKSSVLFFFEFLTGGKLTREILLDAAGNFGARPASSVEARKNHGVGRLSVASDL